MDTLALFRDFARFTEWADAVVFASIRSWPEAGLDELLLSRMRHNHLVQKVFLDVIERRPFDPEETRALGMAALEQFTRNVHRGFAVYHDLLAPEALDVPVELPWSRMIGEKLGFEVHVTTLGDLLVQVFVHTAYHRGQVNARLRELCLDPPMTDFIAWAWAGKPAAVWQGET
jgi:uncharacterized damage-inducible protein DinB